MKLLQRLVRLWSQSRIRLPALDRLPAAGDRIAIEGRLFRVAGRGIDREQGGLVFELEPVAPDRSSVRLVKPLRDGAPGPTWTYLRGAVGIELPSAAVIVYPSTAFNGDWGEGDWGD